MTSSNWLKVNLALEEELHLEVTEREILGSKDHKEVAQLCATLLRQNFIKDHLIKNCIGEIAAMEARLIQLEIKNERPFWLNLFRSRNHPKQEN